MRKIRAGTDRPQQSSAARATREPMLKASNMIAQGKLCGAAVQRRPGSTSANATATLKGSYSDYGTPSGFSGRTNIQPRAALRLPWAIIFNRFAVSRDSSRDVGCYRLRRVAVRSFWILLFLTGCQQKMADQPSYKPLEPCEFFTDGRSERPLVAGTVARGHLQSDIALTTGRRTGKDGQALGLVTPAVIQPPTDSPEYDKAIKARYDAFVDTFPYPMTEQVLQHGYNRYMIYCVVCHDPLGTGQGKIVERGYTAPPSFHIARLRNAPVGHMFAAVSEGYGSMPSYAAQIPLDDRWAIVGYLRALQTSQHYPEDKVPALSQVQKEETP